MKTKGLIFVSCLAAGALIASPAMGKPAKKSSVSKSKRMAPQTTQVTRNYRYNQNISSSHGQHPLLRRNPLQWHALLRGPAICRDALLRRHTQWRQLLWGRHPLLQRRWILPIQRLLLGLAVFELGLRHVLGILPVLGTMAAIRTVVTPTTTRTTRQRTAITHQWLQLCSGALANSVTTTA